MIPSLRPMPSLPAEAGLTRRDLFNLPSGAIAQADALFRRADRSGDGRISPEERAFGLPVLTALQGLSQARGIDAYRRVAALSPAAE